MKLIKKDPVFTVLVAIAIIFVILKPEEVKNYWKFVDWKTIISLAGLIVVTTSIKESGILHLISKRAVYKVGSERKLAFLLIFLSMSLSAIITNDITLLVLVPMTLTISDITEVNLERFIIFETIAVNVGSALTPIGNPQNLFLWYLWGVSFFGFCMEMLPLVALCTLFLLFFVFFSFKNVELKMKRLKTTKVNRNLSIVSVALCILYIAALELKLELYAFLSTTIFFAIFYRDILRKVDWALIVIFILMFIDVGCISKLKIIKTLLESINLNSSNVFLISAILSQIMSNVPATMLITKFSSNWRAISYGVNMGGNGLILASLANLISLRYTKNNFLKNFQKYSIVYFLITLTATYIVFFR